MKLEQEFQVDAPASETWETMIDLERVAGCLPGADIGISSDGMVRGNMKLKLGPIRTSYDGTATLLETDPDRREATIDVEGRELKGQGTAHASVVSRVVEHQGKTLVQIESDIALTGRAAQFGRGVIADVADALLADFSQALEAEIKGESRGDHGDSDSPAAELDLGGAVWLPIARRLGPPLAALVVGTIIGFFVGRGRD